jgi:hypothetical protein
VAGREILGQRFTTSGRVAAVGVKAALRVDIIDMNDSAQPYSCRLCVQLGLAPRGSDRLAPGLRAQVRLSCHVELHPLDLVRACGNQINEQLLHVVKIARPQRE